MVYIVPGCQEQLSTRLKMPFFLQAPFQPLALLAGTVVWWLPVPSLGKRAEARTTSLSNWLHLYPTRCSLYSQVVQSSMM